MLKCPKCGTDNLMTAVFCRGCGERIPLDELKPDDFEDTGEKKNSNAKQNIIGGIIIGVLALGFAVGFLFPSCGKVSYDEELAGKVESRVASALKERGSELSLTDEEASCYATLRLKQYAGKNEGKMGSPEPTGATIRFLGDGRAKVILKGKYHAMPVSVSAVVSVKATGTGRRGVVDLTLDSTPKVGLFPIPDGMRSSLFDNFREVLSKALQEDNRYVKAVKVDEGRITITRTGKKKQ